MLWIIFILSCAKDDRLGVRDAETLSFWTVEGDGRFMAGEAVFNLGDLDGDGADELGFVSAGSENGTPALLYGLRLGDTLADPYFQIPLPQSSWPLTPGSCDDPTVPMHQALLSLGDLDGDGRDELAMSDRDTEHGSVWVIPGAAWDEPTTALSQALRIDGRADTWWFGTDLAAGDINGDGLQDLVVGAPLTGQPGRGGEVWLFSGAVLGSSQGGKVADELGERFTSNRADTLMGERVAVSPDLDGDGLNDVLALSPACGESFQYGGVALIPGHRPIPGGATNLNPTNQLTAEGPIRAGLVPLGDSDLDGVGEFALAGWRLSEEAPYQVAIYATDNGIWRTPSTELETGENSRAQVLSWRRGSGLALLALDGRYVVQVTEPARASGWQKLDSVLLPCDTELRGDQQRLAPGDYDGDGQQDLAVGMPACRDVDGPAQTLVFSWPELEITE